MLTLCLQVEIVAPPERNYSAWIGGSILGTIPLSAVVCFILTCLFSFSEHVQNLVVLQAGIRRVGSGNRSSQYVF